MNHLARSPSLNRSAPYLLHKVSPGDTLAKVIVDHYGQPVGSQGYTQTQTALQLSNPEITDINRIYPGQVIRLFDGATNSAAFCPGPQSDRAQLQGAQPQTDTALTGADVNRRLAENKYQLPDLSRINHYWPKTAQEQEAFFALAWLEHNYGIITTYAGAGINTWGLLVSPPNRALVAEVAHHWRQYQAGVISQNQYNYRRAKAVKALARHLGPYEKLLFNGQTATQAVRINRKKAIPATADILHNLNRLSRMARVAKYGGVVLSVAGVGLACHQISKTSDRHKQNEIFVETLASTLAGGFGSVVLGVVFISNPVGWAVALVAGTGVALSSYAAGRGAVKIYDRNLREFDLVRLSGAASICR